MDKKNDSIKLKQEVIEDFFYYEDQKIVILNNKLFKRLPEDVIVFAKLIINEQGEEEIEAIEDEEYKKVYKAYKDLLKAVNSMEE